MDNIAHRHINNLKHLFYKINNMEKIKHNKKIISSKNMAKACYFRHK